MIYDIGFTQKKFINTADYLFYNHTGRPLDSLEKELLKCFWNGMSYSQIFSYFKSKESNVYCPYSYSYLCRGFAIDLMKNFSDILGEPVNKKSFKEAFKRRWERDNLVYLSKDRGLIDRIISFLHNAIDNNQTNVLGNKDADCSFDYMIYESKGLSDIEIEVLRKSWDDKTYEEIADERNCCIYYIRQDVGSKLWKKISTILGEKVTKKVFKSVFIRRQSKLELEFERLCVETSSTMTVGILEKNVPGIWTAINHYGSGIPAMKIGDRSGQTFNQL